MCVQGRKLIHSIKGKDTFRDKEYIYISFKPDTVHKQTEMYRYHPLQFFSFLLK